MMKKIKEEFYQNKVYLKMSILIVSLTIVPQLIMTPTIKHILSLVLLWVFLILISNLNKIIFAIFTLYISFINILQSNVAMHWGGYTGDLSSRIGVSLQSPAYEVLEYLKEYVDYKDYLVLLYTICILIILFIFLRNYKLSHETTTKTTKKISIIIAIILLAILQNQEPIKIIKYYIKTAQINQAILDRTKFLDSYKYDKNEHNVSSIYDKIIIIQGEAANKHHLNIYGYESKTTPFFSKLLNSGKLYLFNAIAPSNQTRYSVPMFFTKANVLEWFHGYSNSQSIITDFKNNGYKTYWISNQAMRGLSEDSITNIALESDIQKFIASTTQLNATSDIVIKNYIRDEIQHSKDKELFVIHLIGSHASYTKRYTAEYSLHENPKDIIQEYDNSIYFTDFLIKDIVEYFEQDNQKVLMIYSSDHGEIVHTNKNGHGFMPSFKDEYEIPLVVYSNIENKRIKELQDKNKKHYFNAQNLNHFIAYIGGISDDAYISNSSKVFSLDPKNVLDYEKLKFYQ